MLQWRYDYGLVRNARTSGRRQEHDMDSQVEDADYISPAIEIYPLSLPLIRSR